MRKLEKRLISASIVSMGDIGKMMLFILPPTGRVLGVYDKGDEERITARMSALLRSGGLCIPLDSFESFIANLIGSLNPEEHEELAERLIDVIK